MFTLDDLQSAAALVHAVMPPTPQYAWPPLAGRAGCEVWTKHENHTPIGAFKLRGGLVYLDDLMRRGQQGRGLIAATRGNHGQSVAFAGRRLGLPVTVVVPRGNSVEKNAAMRALGAELIEHGADFDESLPHAQALAAERGLAMIPSFHRLLALGVATCALELFNAAPELDAVYVPIGLGSGICGAIGARDLLGLRTRIVGVVSEAAPAYALSFKRGRGVTTNGARTFMDGVACRTPDEEALAAIVRGADRIVRVSENEAAEAIRIYYETTHNLVEGAGAAPLAALMQEREAMRGGRVGLIVSGGNIDRSWFSEILAGGTPRPAAA